MPTLTWGNNIALVINMTAGTLIIMFMCIWALCDTISSNCYNLSIPLLQLPYLLLATQRERKALKDERAHYGVVHKS